MRVLVVAPHPDDESIGCGGTIRTHCLSGDAVVTAFLSSGEAALKQLSTAAVWQMREAESRAAALILGVESLTFLRQPDWCLDTAVDRAASALEPLLGVHRPDIVYLPTPWDDHPDHRAAMPVLQRALAGVDIDPTLLGYEVWTPMNRFDRVVDVSDVMAEKLQAIRCYRSQIDFFRHDRAAEGLAAYRGALAGRCDYAEVFVDLTELNLNPVAGGTAFGGDLW